MTRYHFSSLYSAFRAFHETSTLSQNLMIELTLTLHSSPVCRDCLSHEFHVQKGVSPDGGGYPRYPVEELGFLFLFGQVFDLEESGSKKFGNRRQHTIVSSPSQLVKQCQPSDPSWDQEVSIHH